MPRRVPVASLRPAIDLCKPTGVSLDAGSRVVVMMDRGGVGKALVNRLDKLGADRPDDRSWHCDRSTGRRSQRLVG